MNIPVTFVHSSSDRFLVPVQVAGAPTAGKLTELLAEPGSRLWSVRLPHRRFRRRQRARLAAA